MLTSAHYFDFLLYNPNSARSRPRTKRKRGGGLRRPGVGSPLVRWHAARNNILKYLMLGIAAVGSRMSKREDSVKV